MDLVALYECLCDRTRLRIVNLLREGPLCVCHIQGILDEPQVKISKHLGYLKTHGLVTVKREANWRIYGLVAERSAALAANLACLQDCAAGDKTLRRDSEKLKSLREALADNQSNCCAKPAPVETTRSSRSRKTRSTAKSA